jgi:hypothetical protein
VREKCTCNLLEISGPISWVKTVPHAWTTREESIQNMLQVSNSTTCCLRTIPIYLMQASIDHYPSSWIRQTMCQSCYPEDFSFFIILFYLLIPHPLTNKPGPLLVTIGLVIMSIRLNWMEIIKQHKVFQIMSSHNNAIPLLAFSTQCLLWAQTNSFILQPMS